MTTHEMNQRPDPEQHVDLPEDTETSVEINRAVGKQVKLLREKAGWTQRELADRLGYSEDLISSLERGRRTPQPEFLDAADELLEAGGLLRVTKGEVAKARAKARVRHPAWFRDYARLEREAVEASFYGTLTMPGLLQTEDHSRALFAMRKPALDEETIEQRVMARLARQDILTRWPAPILSCIIEESVLLRPIGGSEVHRGQLQNLLCLGELARLEIQVMPMDRPEHAALGGAFTLLTPRGRAQMAYVEVQHVSRLITDREEVRILAARYGSLRAQALTPRESLVLIKKMLGEQ